MTDFSVTAAIRCKAAGRLEAWIHEYLNHGAWANPALSDGLRLQERFWLGPVVVRTESLSRCYGPEPWMEILADPVAWDGKVRELATGLSDPRLVPPLIVQYRAGELSVRDGNHRLAAMELRGWTTCWAIIWFDSAAERDACLRKNEASPR